jgi:hypothetical protein
MAWRLEYNVGGAPIHVGDVVISKRGLEARVVQLRTPSGARNDPGAVFVQWLDVNAEGDRPSVVYAPPVFDAVYVEITDEAALRDELAYALMQEANGNDRS